MKYVARIVEEAQGLLAHLLQAALDRRPVSTRQYVRYLSMQYHLIKGMQRHFVVTATHSHLHSKHALRRGLLEFAHKQELDYVMVDKELQTLSRFALPEPLDVTLWHAYFQEVVLTRPFVRLGAECVLENISGGVAQDVIERVIHGGCLHRDSIDFLLMLQRHQLPPRGEQILAALSDAALSSEELADLAEGASRGAVMYLSMAEWALTPVRPGSFPEATTETSQGGSQSGSAD